VGGSRSMLVVGAVVVAAGLVACWTSKQTWVTITLPGSKQITIGGFDHALLGHTALWLGIAGIVGGVAVAVTSRLPRWRPAALVAVAGIGIAGVVLVVHETRHLRNLDTIFSRLPQLRPLFRFFGFRAATGWGLWACGAAFAAMTLVATAAGAAVVVRTRRRPRE
jgi:hypothetical protein